MERREFLAGLAVTSLVSTVGHSSQQPEAGTPETLNLSRLPLRTKMGVRKGDMLYNELGWTGVQVSAVGLGGSHVAKPSVQEDETVRLIHQAIDRGMTFMDNSWDYNQGQSEIRMGKALAQNGYRQKVFLMTKIDGRTKEEAARQIETSLQRLQTDHIDLLQHHEVLRYDDPDRIFAPGGAMEAFLEAKKAGKIRFIGFTGHKDPHVHLYMFDVAAQHGFHFDTVQMPINVMDAHFRSFAQLVVPRALKEKTGVLSMKPFGGGDGIILKSNTVQPLDCLHYAMNLPTSVVITGIDKQQALDQAFQAAKTFQLLNQQQVASILAKTQQAALNGQYELFKTSAHFDSTAKHPDWLGGEAPGVQKMAPPNAG